MRSAEAKLESVLGPFQAFMTPILRGTDRSTRKMGKIRLEVLGGGNTGRGYADTFARILRGPDSKSPSNYPEPATLWHYGDVFREAGDVWAAGPLMLYAAGHLVSFVQVIAATDTSAMSIKHIRKLLDCLPAAVRGDEDARKVWTFTDGAGWAWPHPNKAKKMMPKPLPASIKGALLNAKHFELPYEMQRATVLEYLKQWADDLIAQEKPKNQKA